MSHIGNSIKKWLEDNMENIIADVIQALRIPSESYDRKGVQASLAQLLETARKLGLKTELRADGEVGVVPFGEGNETLGILVHADTVPVGDIRQWTYSPYGQLVGDRIYGRGAVDNKGVVISSLYAMAAVKALGMPVFKKVELIIGTREEITWDDLILYQKEGHPLPDYGFTPDGEFPIINREKGSCDIHVVFSGEACSGELEVLDIKSGDAVNTVPGSAYARIRGNIRKVLEKAAVFNRDTFQEKLTVEQTGDGEVLVTAMGKAVHSSLPELGDNALTSFCVFLAGLDIGNTAVRKFAGFVKEYFDDNYYGDALGLCGHPEVLKEEEAGRTTVVPTVAYMNGGVHLYLNIRATYGTERKEICDTFDRLARMHGFTYTIMDYLDPLYVPGDSKFIQVLAEAYEEATGEKAQLILTGGTSYAKALPGSVAFGPVFSRNDDVAHQADEYIPVDKLMKATEIYSLAIAKVLFDDKSLIK